MKILSQLLESGDDKWIIAKQHLEKKNEYRKEGGSATMTASSCPVCTLGTVEEVPEE